MLLGYGSCHAFTNRASAERVIHAFAGWLGIVALLLATDVPIGSVEEE
jgi:hypothetical protein